MTFPERCQAREGRVWDAPQLRTEQAASEPDDGPGSGFCSVSLSRRCGRSQGVPSPLPDPVAQRTWAKDPHPLQWASGKPCSWATARVRSGRERGGMPCGNAGECVFLPREVQTVGRKCVGGTRLRPLGQARGAQVRLGSGKRAAVGQRGFHLGHGPSIAIIHAFIPGPFVGCVLCARRWLGNETTDVNNTRSPPCGRWLWQGRRRAVGTCSD